MTRSLAALLVFLTCCFVVISCDSASVNERHQDELNGTINISVDETFKPVIEEQIKVFESSWPETDIVAHYKPEAECFRDLQSDSTRMVIVARGLNAEERKFFKNKLDYVPSYELLAFDAVAVIVNKSANDSVFTMEQLSSYLRGDDTNRQVVVDSRNASSTVRFLMDSVLRGTNFGGNVTAAENSDAVIDFVAANKRAIGIVGVSWVIGRENTKQAESIRQVKTALLECRICEKGTFARPSQATISTGQYPLYRGLYYILKENTTGPGGNFAGFMKYERGQLIFRRAQLVPARMQFNKRSTDISEQE